MAASDEWTEWHLTASGWVRGSIRRDGSGLESKEAPSDRVLTIRYQEYFGSGMSPMKEYTTELYRSENNDHILRLIKKFGESPKSL